MGEIRANIVLPTGVLIYQYNPDSSASPSLSTPGILVNISVVAFGLSGPPTAIHIHGFSAIGVSAGVLVPICGPPLTTSCSLPTSNTESSDAQFAFQRSFQVVAPAGAASSFGSAYVNVHTQKNGMGEVRGQMALIQSLPSIGNLLPITPPAPAPAPVPGPPGSAPPTPGAGPAASVDSNDSAKLSGGSIAGIVIGSILGAALIAVVSFVAFKRYQAHSARSPGNQNVRNLPHKKHLQLFSTFHDLQLTT